MTTIAQMLGDKADYLLGFNKPKISKDRLHVPGPDFVDRIYSISDRNNRVLVNLSRLFHSGRLAGSGYLSILPVDQGIEHSAGATFAENPDYFDPENIVKLAVEGGCNAVASTFGVLGAISRKYAHKIPFLVKFNHNELLTYPNKHDQIFFGTVKEAAEMGAVAVGATIYFGSDRSDRQIVEVAGLRIAPMSSAWPPSSGATSVTTAFKNATAKHRLPSLRRPHRPGQPPRRHHRGRYHQTETPREQRRLRGPQHGKTLRLCTPLHRPSDHPIDLCRYQVPIATWAASASLTPAANPRANDLEKPS